MQPLFQKPFEGIIWSSIISNDNNLLVLDVRNEAEKSIEYFKLNLDTYQIAQLLTQPSSWWSMIERFDQQLFLSEYKSENDPNSKMFYRLDGDNKKEIAESEIPYSENVIIQPSIYEPGSGYFKTVREFLGLDLPCACEYLEIDRKIILSYYLRSGKELERYLLVLQEGKKAMKVLQDNQMNGFASGSFFVVNGRLIFIKNRNEIFVYAI